MAYEPLNPILPNGSTFTRDHLAHVEAGITGVGAEAEAYVDTLIADVQAGQVTDPAFDAAVTRAIADGRLVVDGGGTSEPLDVIEVAPGVYEITGTTVTEVEPGVYQIGA